jgi:L-lactate dehydrogenase (cytochrome)
MDNNQRELAGIALRQRVLPGIAEPTLETQVMGSRWAMPVVLGPVGATGMYARRGEVQAARAAQKAGVPYTLSTVSVCPIEEVARAHRDSSGRSSMCCATGAICAMRWSGRGRRG